MRFNQFISHTNSIPHSPYQQYPKIIQYEPSQRETYFNLKAKNRKMFHSMNIINER